MGIKVLLADDNTTMLGFLKKLVEKVSVVEKVVGVKNGREAVEQAQAFAPDVICLDVEMPEMDGLTALREIKALQKAGKVNAKTKVIILSGTMHENDSNVRRAKFLGADYVFPKPGGKDMSFSIDAQVFLKAIKDAG
ncbi:MAG: response regulator [Deltaproteobacteria bacterium]|nr:response regulator [Deltaproteobacteria bacterium]